MFDSSRNNLKEKSQEQFVAASITSRKYDPNHRFNIMFNHFFLQPNTVKLALHFAKPIKYLLDHCHEFVAIKDLPLAEDNDKIELASTLWTEKLISVK